MHTSPSSLIKNRIKSACSTPVTNIICAKLIFAFKTKKGITNVVYLYKCASRTTDSL